MELFTTLVSDSLRQADLLAQSFHARIAANDSNSGNVSARPIRTGPRIASWSRAPKVRAFIATYPRGKRSLRHGHAPVCPPINHIGARNDAPKSASHRVSHVATYFSEICG